MYHQKPEAATGRAFQTPPSSSAGNAISQHQQHTIPSSLAAPAAPRGGKGWRKWSSPGYRLRFKSIGTKEETGCRANCLWLVTWPAKSNSEEIWSLREPWPTRHTTYVLSRRGSWPGRGEGSKKEERTRNCPHSSSHRLPRPSLGGATLDSVSPSAKTLISTKWSTTTQ